MGISRIVKVTLSLLFIFYWIFTFFFNLPENYAKAKFIDADNYFNLFLFQRWGFFAPPPTYNDRLYYSFKTKGNTKLKIIEVINNINKKKQAQAPFNEKVDVLDYLISNSILSMLGDLNEGYKLNEYLAASLHNDSLKKLQYLFKPDVESKDNFRVLLSYGRNLARHRGLLGEYDSVALVLTKIDIPKFYLRNIDTTMAETIIYKSSFQSLK